MTENLDIVGVLIFFKRMIQLCMMIYQLNIKENNIDRIYHIKTNLHKLSHKSLNGFTLFYVSRHSRLLWRHVSNDL